jgi:hypothetical protein
MHCGHCVPTASFQLAIAKGVEWMHGTEGNDAHAPLLAVFFQNVLSAISM